MTKAKARARAKAKAGQKTRRREANADRTDQTIKKGQFDPRADSSRHSAANTGPNIFGGARRGAPRSK
jgi:hypothetical protein